MTNPARFTAGIQWLRWDADLFAEARATRRPVLLSVSASWSEGCRFMDRTAYADTAVIEAADGVLPVRIDADERPDLADRFDAGGLPATLLLTPEGEVLGGGTVVEPARLRDAMGLAVDAVRAAHVRGSALAPDDDAAMSLDDDALEGQVFRAFDAVHGGFGSAPKFPHTAPVRLALDLHDDGDPAMLERASRTLDAMGWGELLDAADGAFHRCCARPDWTRPQREKLLTVNASLLHLFAEAAERTRTARWLLRAKDAARFLDTQLRRADGTWRMAAAADSARVFSDANAVAVSAMLCLARVTSDAALASRALASLEHVLLSSYKPGEGIAHRPGGVRGLLTDGVAMSAASLDAWEATGNVVYRMMAEELMASAGRTMWDERTGGFFDRAESLFPGECGVAARPLKPFVLNCEAAVVLARLCDATGDAQHVSIARQALDAVALQARLHGPLAAHLLLARRAVLR